MTPKHLKVELSATEMPQFRRLVDFANEIERYADEQCIVELQAMVHRLLDDLADMRR